MMTKATTLILLLCFPIAGFSQENQPLEDIRQQVSQYVMEAAQAVSPADTIIELNVGKLSAQLNLPKCGESPELFVRNGKLTQRHITMGARCNTANADWTVYVPVSIQRYADVYVANGNIARGQTIAAASLRKERMDIARLHRGYITDINSLNGKVALRNISNGLPLRPDSVDNASTITKGETVVIAANLQGIFIKMQGKALAKGSTGDLILVKNLSSNKIVEAEVVRPGVVQVRM